VTVAASVESAGSEVLVVRPEGLVSGLTVGPGALVEVSWAGADEERSGLPPEPGTDLGLGLSLTADDLVTARGRVVRLQDHAGTWTVSVEFVDLPERDADRVRRSVFGALREQRAAETADD
jgi:hypothetical protein